jgi:hypothetical protein
MSAIIVEQRIKQQLNRIESSSASADRVNAVLELQVRSNGVHLFDLFDF